LKNEEISYHKLLDELLDKINRRGYESLTPRERELLEEASRHLGKKNNRKNGQEEKNEKE